MPLNSRLPVLHLHNQTLLTLRLLDNNLDNRSQFVLHLLNVSLGLFNNGQSVLGERFGGLPVDRRSRKLGK